MTRILPGLMLLFIVFASKAQNKILGVVGSSTAKGVGASVPANAWVNRVTAYYTAQNVLASTTNLAESGYDPYYAMPTGYVPPPSRPSPDVNRNITRLLTFNPDVVIIAFANNNYQTYSFEEIHATLDTIYNRTVTAGKIAYVATSQPRTGFTLTQRQKLRDIKDSIIKWFGAYSINFFDPIADPVDLTIKAEYRFSSDQVHLNDAGHEVLFNQVVAKNIFSGVLNSGLQNFSLKRIGSSRVDLSWSNPSEKANTVYFIERKQGRNAFTSIGSIMSGNQIKYQFSDINAIGEGLQYRIRIQNGSLVKYSTILSVQGQGNERSLSVRGNPATATLNLLISTDSQESTNIRVIDYQGRVVISQQVSLAEGTNSISIPINSLTKGQYIGTVTLKGQQFKTVFQKQ